jgi:hypothetical protein
MEIRVRAFESCCTPASDGLDRLSSAVVRTKRDVMQSGKMTQSPDLLVDPIKEITAGKRRSLVLENRDIRDA